MDISRVTIFLCGGRGKLYKEGKSPVLGGQVPLGPCSFFIPSMAGLGWSAGVSGPRSQAKLGMEFYGRILASMYKALCFIFSVGKAEEREKRK